MRRSIHTKSLLIFGFMLCALLLVVALCARFIVLDGFMTIERSVVAKNLQRVHASLNSELEGLQGLLADWAPWDLSYNYLTGHYPAYVRDNIDAETLHKLRLNVLLFVDTRGKTRYLRVEDYAHQRSGHLSPASVRLLLQTTVLYSHHGTRDVHAGLLMLPEGPLLVASRPIVHNDYSGPIAGTLVMGRFLDAEEIRFLSVLINQPIYLQPYQAPALPTAFRAARAQLIGNTPTYITALNRDTVAGYMLLRDLNMQPILIMQVPISRTIYRLGANTIAYFLSAIVIIGLLLGVVFTLQLDRAVLTRVTELGKGLQAIRGADAFAARVALAPPYLWPDELDTLAETVNETLGVLEQAHHALLLQETLRESEAQYRGLIESSPDALYVFHEMSCVFVNTAGVALLRAGSPYEVIGLNALACIPEVHHILVRELYATVLTGAHERSRRIEVAFQRFDQSQIDVEYTVTLFTYQGKPAVYAIVRDITERKQAEQAIASYQQRLRALSTELSLAEEKERHRIASDLHDHIGQTLVATRLVLGTVQETLTDDASVTPIADVRQQLERAIEWTRTLTVDLYPPILSTRGFEDAARWLCDAYQTRYHLEITLSADTRGLSLPDGLRGMLFAVLRELLLNVVKHARATHVNVVLNRRGDAFSMVVEDNGVGFSLAAISECEGFGLFSIQERIHYGGGRVIIDSAPGHGTRVFVTLPLAEKSAPPVNGGSHAG